MKAGFFLGCPGFGWVDAMLRSGSRSMGLSLSRPSGEVLSVCLEAPDLILRFRESLREGLAALTLAI